MTCTCNNFEFIASGGAVCSGAADILPIISSGGAGARGTARVFHSGQAYDGFAAIWPLDESGSGEIDEYQDRSGNGLLPDKVASLLKSFIVKSPAAVPSPSNTSRSSSSPESVRIKAIRFSSFRKLVWSIYVLTLDF